MSFDVIVIGAGHAGIEAAYSSAKLGCEVAICTLSPNTVAHMPCNPAIGGTAKGHLVREIDALGGLMGRAIDATGLQFKLLNRGRGPAVRSPRAQADKQLYRDWVRQEIGQKTEIDWLFGSVEALAVEHGRIRGVYLNGGEFLRASSVIVTTGTFLNGVIHEGPDQRPAGRHNEPPSVGLARSIRNLGFKMGRLKTGTPPRLDRRSIDFRDSTEKGVFIEERGDVEPTPFSFLTHERLTNRISCWLLHTNERVHDIVRRHIDRSPLFNGQIQGIGPRYCPSLEDKIMRFPERERHQIYLEPEGIDSEQIYVNGLSMSMPREVQSDIVHALPGLESAVILRPGYAIEYDFVQPTELRRTLETRRVDGLYFAGQLNGTSGYEEAAAQGLVAGINAARKVRGESEFALGREQAYVGVLVDDLVSRGCLEPYRMFTSRAEHRLLLRIDNADLRLTPLGREAGLVCDERWSVFSARRERFERNAVALERHRVRSTDGEGMSAAQLLRRPDVNLAQLAAEEKLPLEVEPEFGEVDLTSLETAVKYAGYHTQELARAARTGRNAATRIPSGFAFDGIPGLSREVIQRLTERQPETVGQASSIPGMTPAAMAVLQVFLRRWTSQLPESVP